MPKREPEHAGQRRHPRARAMRLPALQLRYRTRAVPRARARAHVGGATANNIP